MNQIGELLNELYGVIKDRQVNPLEGAYTTYLFDKGIDKICKMAKSPRRSLLQPKIMLKMR